MSSQPGSANVAGPLVGQETVPPWLRPLVAASASISTADLTRIRIPASDPGRPAAVLVLFAEDSGGSPDVLLIRRADGLSSHPGQVAFPGGAVEPGDGGVVEAAVREAVEEVGLLASGVRPVALYPSLYLPPSGFLVSPVIAHWERPSPVTPVDLAETAAVARVPIGYLADPDNRCMVRHSSGHIGPAFLVPGMLVWGFTGGLLSGLLSIAGWERPWSTGEVLELDVAWRTIGELPGQPGMPHL